MAKLKIEMNVKDDPTSTLQAVGEIYEVHPNGRLERLKAPGVIVSQFQSHAFPAAKFKAGKYRYRFHVERAGGEFSLRVLDVSFKPPEPIKQKTFNTDLGVEGKVMSFEVE